MSFPNLWIAGLGSQYAEHGLLPDQLEEFASRFYDVEAPGYVMCRTVGGSDCH
jgi:hypothetical protein